MTFLEIGSGYGWALLQTLLALIAVSVLAWVVLRWAARRGLGANAGRIRILDRRKLNPQSELHLVEVEGRALLVGTGESSAPALLAEWRLEDIDADKRDQNEKSEQKAEIAEDPAS